MFYIINFRLVSKFVIIMVPNISICANTDSFITKFRSYVLNEHKFARFISTLIFL